MDIEITIKIGTRNVDDAGHATWDSPVQAKRTLVKAESYHTPHLLDTCADQTFRLVDRMYAEHKIMQEANK